MISGEMECMHNYTCLSNEAETRRVPLDAIPNDVIVLLCGDIAVSSFPANKSHMRISCPPAEASKLPFGKRQMDSTGHP